MPDHNEVKETQMTNSLTISTSPFDVGATADKLETLLKTMGIHVFARIDHGEAARQNGLKLQDEIVIVFGDPKVGTHLMHVCPELGIELPLKILIWHQEKTNIGYRDPEQLLTEYEITGNREIIKKMSGLMARLVKEVIEQ